MSRHLTNVTTILRHDEMLMGTRLYIMQELGNRRYVAKPVDLEFIPLEVNMTLPEATMMFSSPHGTAFLQSMSDSLFELGFRPSGDKSLAVSASAELRATKIHLEDMRVMSNRLLDAALTSVVSQQQALESVISKLDRK